MAAATENAVFRGPASGICANADASAAMPHPARSINSFDSSLFCQRLEKLADQSPEDTSLENLVTATKRLLGHAKAISDQVVRFLPQFTLHNGTHLWNVLSFMEELAGGKVGIDQLEAGDCAMAVWACFLHDLGMVLEAGELAGIEAADSHDLHPGSADPPAALAEPRVQAWRAYRDGHSLWESIRSDPHPDSEPCRIKLGIIRAAFIRDTHARLDPHTGHSRIADWLGLLAGSDRLIAQVLEDYAVAHAVIRVAVSHNQDISWLPYQLRALTGDDRLADYHSGLGSIHWAWIGWLLRLADVFDCDASRTPQILFDHGGITDPLSSTEWRKHLSIRHAPVWKAGNRQDELLFTCVRSPSPAVEKALHQIIGWMNHEITQCGSALNRMPAEYRGGIQLALPSLARVDIKEREDDYLYQDIEFRLERDVVVELLMGESLYGGPELALRELVQNALDAVHLRDQRNRLAAKLEKVGKGEKPLQPHEYWTPGTHGEVHVEWGTEADGQSWIRVRDNGVGMTLGTMRRFLTQVGRSYYKSPDFLSEQAQMRRYDIVCAAISQFGIGFLSVFMLADRVEIRTRPVDAEARPDKTKPDWEETGRFPFRADIHGPHGLLAFYPDKSIGQPGTEVKLWLKGGKNGEKPFVLPKWNRELVLARLRKEFYAQELGDEMKQQLAGQSAAANGRRLLDPAFEIGSLIVWPLYPVHLVPPERGEGLTLDDRFHFTVLIALDRNRLAREARKWEEILPEVATAEWRVCDWEDSETGSRVRLVAVQPGNEVPMPTGPAGWAALPDTMTGGRCRLALHILSEAGLPGHEHRYQCLVNGVRIVPGFVPSGVERDCQLSRILEDFPVWPGTGGWFWIDLRGAAMPRLRADRSAMTRKQPADWGLQNLHQRWQATWPELLPSWLRSMVLCPGIRDRALPFTKYPLRLGLHSLTSGLACENLRLERKACNAATFLSWEQRSRIARDLEFACTPFDPRLPVPAWDWETTTGNDVRLALNEARSLARGFAFDPARDLGLNDGIHSDFEFDFYLTRAINQKEIQTFLQFLRLHLLSECSQPCLNRALPALGWGAETGLAGNYHLAGPLHVQTENPLQVDHWLTTYDLVAPATAIALHRLRVVRPDWLTQRGERALFLLPFLHGREPRTWRGNLEHKRPFERLMLFLPSPNHYEWLFTEHPQEDWAQGCASSLWDLKTGQVLYASGIHTENSLRLKGLPLSQWLGVPSGFCSPYPPSWRTDDYY